MLGYGAPAGHQFPSHNRQRALSSPATQLACRFSGRRRVFHHDGALTLGPFQLLSVRRKKKEKGWDMHWSVLKGHSGGRRHVWLLLGLLSAAIPLAAATDLIYVTNRGGTTIDVIDAKTNKVVQSIGNIESPEVVRFSPDGRLLYIFSRELDNALIVMDRKSGKTIKKVPLSGWANEAQTTKDGKLILVCIRQTGTKAEDTGALDIIDTTTLEKVKSIPVRRGLHDLAVTADGKYVAGGAPGGRFLGGFDLQKVEGGWEV